MSAPARDVVKLLDLVFAGYNRALPNADGSRGPFQPIFDEGVVQTTFCNQFVHFVCAGLGYTSLMGKTANEIVAFLADPANGWIDVDDAVAQDHANHGVLVIAARANPSGHGHVNIVIPGFLDPSESFARPVPKCANVGATVFLGKKISFAFRATEPPRYWALAGMV